MALSGTLGDFGIADIFQLIGQQQKTGVLHLLGKEEEVHIAFKDGNVVKAETASRKRKELLGHMLVRAQIIDPQQLEVALDEQRRTLRRLGDILTASGAVTREQLREMTHLQTTETLYRLFAWKQGSYNFEQQDVEYDRDAVTPIRSESVLMEGFRRVDEWPAVRRVIGSARMTFERLKEPPAPKAEPTGDDFNLDAAFGDGDHDEPKKGELGRAERKVMSLWKPGRTAADIIDLSRLGEFEACKALASLCGEGYLQPIAPSGKDDDDRLGGGKPITERLRETAGSAVATMLLVAAAVFVFGQSGLGGAQRLSEGELPLSDAPAERLVARGQLERIAQALEVYRLEHGEVPEALDALQTESLISATDLQIPYGERYYYRRTAQQTYLLLPPLR